MTKLRKDTNKLSQQETNDELTQEKNKENDFLRKKMNAATDRNDAEKEFENIKTKISDTKQKIKDLITEAENIKASYVESYGDQKKRDKRTHLRNNIELEQNKLTSNKNNFEQAEKYQTELSSEQEKVQERNRQLKNRVERTRDIITSQGKSLFKIANKYVNNQTTKKELQDALINSAALKLQDHDAEFVIRQVYDDAQTTHLQNYGTWWGMGVGIIIAVAAFYREAIKKKT